VSAPVAGLAIAHVTGETGFSGGEVQLFLLMEGLRARGHRCALICPPASRSAERAGERDFELWPVPMRASASPLGMGRVAAALRRCAPQLVHLHTGRANWLGAPAARWLSLPAITTRRMDRPVSRGLRTHWLYGPGVARAVAISRAVERCLLDAGVPREKVALIPSAVDPAALRPSRDRAALRRDAGLSDDTLCLLALASLDRRKGIDVLLEAVRRLPRELPVRCWIAGDGPERVALERLAASPELRERVRLLGRREDRADLLAICDALVLPSRREGLGVAALEAMACSRPVVASRVGGLAEAVVDGGTGLLVPPDEPKALTDALLRLASEPGLRARLAAGGPARIAQGHLPEQMTEAYERLYRAVLAERSA
jgi:glycosyltransferase involved in cell wall biosynthesis